MGVQEHKTKVINATLNPRWNASMQFTIKDLEQDVLCITVFDRDLFSPNGKTSSTKDILLINFHQLEDFLYDFLYLWKIFFINGK